MYQRVEMTAATTTTTIAERMLCARESFLLYVATLFTVFVGSYTLELWLKGLCSVA